MTRTDVTFTAGNGTCSAWLYTPWLYTPGPRTTGPPAGHDPDLRPAWLDGLDDRTRLRARDAGPRTRMQVPRDVAARFALQILRYFPGRQARNVRCPILFSICEPDTVAPAKPTQRYAVRAPRGEIRLYDTGHFDIYLGDAFEQNIADQLDFLTRHASPSAADRQRLESPSCLVTT